MSTVYTGFDPFTPGSYVAGTGRFLSVTIPSDSNDISAASIGIGMMALMDNCAYLAHHMINGVDGGTFAGPLSLTQLQLIKNVDSFAVNHPIVVGSDLNLNALGKNIYGPLATFDVVHALTSITSDGAINGATATITGNTNVKNVIYSGFGASASGPMANATTETRTGATTMSGANAYVKRRFVVATVSSNNTVAAESFDHLGIPGGIIMGLTITIAAPVAGAPLLPQCISRRCAGAQLHHATIVSPSGLQLGTLQAGTDSIGMFWIEWDGSDWIAYGVVGVATIP